jgi:hypothetical protein
MHQRWLTLHLVALGPPWLLVEYGQVEVRERKPRYSTGKGHARNHLIISWRLESESEGAMAGACVIGSADAASICSLQAE